MQSFVFFLASEISGFIKTSQYYFFTYDEIFDSIQNLKVTLPLYSPLPPSTRGFIRRERGIMSQRLIKVCVLASHEKILNFSKVSYSVKCNL